MHKIKQKNISYHTLSVSLVHEGAHPRFEVAVSKLHPDTIFCDSALRVSRHRMKGEGGRGCETRRRVRTRVMCVN
jgi:hypothetical protein